MGKCIKVRYLVCLHLHHIWTTTDSLLWLATVHMGNRQVWFRQLRWGMEWCHQVFLEWIANKISTANQVCMECQWLLHRCLERLIKLGVWTCQARVCKWQVIILVDHHHPYLRICLYQLNKNQNYNLKICKRLKKLHILRYKMVKFNPSSLLSNRCRVF